VCSSVFRCVAVSGRRRTWLQGKHESTLLFSRVLWQHNPETWRCSGNLLFISVIGPGRILEAPRSRPSVSFSDGKVMHNLRATRAQTPTLTHAPHVSERVDGASLFTQGAASKCWDLLKRRWSQDFLESTWLSGVPFRLLWTPAGLLTHGGGVGGSPFGGPCPRRFESLC
jgi:hypothetical protein